MDKFIPFKRLRKASPNPKKYLRLHRAEFGHSFSKKKINKKNFTHFYYPDPSNLITNISKLHKLPESFINIGLGSESLIKDIFLWHSKKFRSRRVCFGLPNYFMYSLNAKINKYKIFNFNINPANNSYLNSDFIINYIKKKKNSLLILVNPSHPFEKNWNIKELKKIISFCQKNKIIILIDEVYQGLGSTSVDNFTKKYSNLIVIRSFSKAFGLPGLRIGYSLTSNKFAHEIETFRLAIELPQICIDDSLKFLSLNRKKIKKHIYQIISARMFAHSEFKKRNIFSYGHYGNSVTFYCKNNVVVKNLGNFLLKNNVIVNYSYSKPFDQFINITTTNKMNLKYFFKILDRFKNIKKNRILIK